MLTSILQLTVLQFIIRLLLKTRCVTLVYLTLITRLYNPIFELYVLAASLKLNLKLILTVDTLVTKVQCENIDESIDTTRNKVLKYCSLYSYFSYIEKIYDVIKLKKDMEQQICIYKNLFSITSLNTTCLNLLIVNYESSLHVDRHTATGSHSIGICYTPSIFFNSSKFSSTVIWRGSNDELWAPGVTNMIDGSHVAVNITLSLCRCTNTHHHIQIVTLTITNTHKRSCYLLKCSGIPSTSDGLSTTVNGRNSTGTEHPGHTGEEQDGRSELCHEADVDVVADTAAAPHNPRVVRRSLWSPLAVHSRAAADERDTRRSDDAADHDRRSAVVQRL
ncbi:hypothetical protein AGLY_014468 [Aphis glycines]|uniref:Uncharacterized protein n=1 Tax=Aphis glycines TaxID=307491 RepID=A0A6G0T4D4_APHGL|nr:hypothetical protein AGLY_014468 [Aphis glycines]